MAGRTLARVAAVQALFQCDQAGDSPEVVIDQFLRHRADPEANPGEAVLSAGDLGLFGRVVRGAAGLDERIAQALPESWPMGRLDPVLRCVLRAGASELADQGSAPARVVINEYVEVAHGFFTGDEAKMVNGVLDRMAHDLRPAEFRAGAGSD